MARRDTVALAISALAAAVAGACAFSRSADIRTALANLAGTVSTAELDSRTSDGRRIAPERLQVPETSEAEATAEP